MPWAAKSREKKAIWHWEHFFTVLEGPLPCILSVNKAVQSLDYPADYQAVSKVITNEGISEITLHAHY